MGIKDRWISDCIDGVDLLNIEWVRFDENELKNFYRENYLDGDTLRYVANEPNVVYFYSPLGLRYLSFNYNNTNYKFLLGIVKNKVGKKTIVAAMIYLENYYMFEEQKYPLTYIYSLEVNSYFWNNGVYKRLCEAVINFINHDQHIILSTESDMGRKCRVGGIFKEILVRNGFKKTIWMDTFSNYSNPEFYDVVCSKNKVLEKTCQ